MPKSKTRKKLTKREVAAIRGHAEIQAAMGRDVEVYDVCDMPQTIATVRGRKVDLTAHFNALAALAIAGRFLDDVSEIHVPVQNGLGTVIGGRRLARMIGQSICDCCGSNEDGLFAMQDVAMLIRQQFGSTAASELDCAWNGVGQWRW